MHGIILLPDATSFVSYNIFFCFRDNNLLVQSELFSKMGKVQPFTVSMSTNSQLLMVNTQAINHHHHQAPSSSSSSSGPHNLVVVSLAADPSIGSLVQPWSYTFMEIDH